MKKIFSIILAISIIVTSVPFAFAADHSHGEVILEEFVNDEETAFCTVYEDGCAVVEGEGYADFDYSDIGFWVEDYDFSITTIYIGADITEINNIPSYSELVIDENNPYLSADEDGSIYNKDKTELILFNGSNDRYTVASSVKTLKSGCFEDAHISDLTIPDSVEIIESHAFQNCNVGYLELPDTLKVIPALAFFALECEALIIPSSVEKIEDYAFGGFRFGIPMFGDYCETVLFIMNPECEIGKLSDGIKLIGYSGSTAENYANENGNVFDYLDKEHKHIFLSRVIKAPTCTESGISIYDCPCGNAEPYKGVIKSYGHDMDYDSPAADGNVYCERCGVMADCDCICHKAQKPGASNIEIFLYKVYVVFWRLFRIKEECPCGNSSHYSNPY